MPGMTLLPTIGLLRRIPENALTIIRTHYPAMTAQFHADQLQRPVDQGGDNTVAIGEYSKALNNWIGDLGETRPYRDQQGIQLLSKVLDDYLELATTQYSAAFR